MFSTHGTIHVSISNQFLVRVRHHPLCKGSKRPIHALHAQCVELGHVISQRYNRKKFSKNLLLEVAIQSSQYHILSIPESLFNKWPKSFKKLRFIHGDNNGASILFTVHHTHQSVCFQTVKSTLVMCL